MKLLTLNFLTCATKPCKSAAAAFPLHIRDAELERVDVAFQPQFIRNVLPRVEWAAFVALAAEVGLSVPRMGVEGSKDAETAADEEMPEAREAAPEAMDVTAPTTQSTIDPSTDANAPPDPATLTDADARVLHELLLETQIVSGKLVCGNCGHEYAVREGIANFLLPAHLV